jgi:rod shape-determining protein MreD
MGLARRGGGDNEQAGPVRGGGVPVRWAVFVLVAVGALFMQVAVFSGLEVGGARPEMVLLIVLFFALHMKEREAAVMAWVLGLLQDLLSGGVLGIHALSFMVVALVASRFREEIFFGHILTQVLIAFPAALLVGALSLARLKVLSSSLDINAGVECATAAAAYTALVAPFAFALLTPLKRPLGLFSRRDFFHV